MQTMSTIEATGLRNMRDRRSHACARCQSPMARQEFACWRCGTQWAAEHEPRTPLRVIRGGAPEEARLYADRWVDEGGSLGAEATDRHPPPPRADERMRIAARMASTHMTPRPAGSAPTITATLGDGPLEGRSHRG